MTPVYTDKFQHRRVKEWSLDSQAPFLLSAMKNHYVYLLLGEDGRYYYGVRTCVCDPKEDDYTGSYRDKSFKPKRKRILSVWDSREAALEEEIRIHNLKEVAASPRYANKAKQTSVGFDTTGITLSEEHLKKVSDGVKAAMTPEVKAKISASVKEARKGRKDWAEKQSQLLSEWNKSEDHKRRIRGDLNPMHRPEVKQKLREANLGELNPHYGKPTSQKQKEASSAAHLNKPKSEAQKKKMSETAKGRKPINNGERRSWLKDGEELPSGWKFGWDLG